MMRLLNKTVLGAMLAWATVTPSFAVSSDLEDRLRTLVHTFQEQYGFPGATVGYVLPHGTAGGVAVGSADIEVNIEMSAESRMLAASIGKTMVGALVLALETDGTLHRSDHVSQYLDERSWFARLPNAATMTIGQLLTHTAGLPDHVHIDGVPAQLVALGHEGGSDPEDAIAFVLDTPPLFDAGTAWSYSDTGYLLLGMAIEAATGRDYYDLVGEKFLDPLGLDLTDPSTRPMLPGLAVGYTVEGNPFDLPARTADENGVLLWNPAIEWTGGGLISASNDLARWGHALFTGAALQQPYLDRLLDGAPVHPDAPGVFYGSGVAIYSETEFGTVYGHGGWVPGYVSSLRHYARDGFTVAFQINSDVGVVDDRTDLVPAFEAALANLIAASAAVE